jgi:hypothetical protein
MTSKLRPILPVNLIAVWLMVASACQVIAVDPVVSNVKAKQREGSRLVVLYVPWQPAVAYCLSLFYAPVQENKAKLPLQVLP